LKKLLISLMLFGLWGCDDGPSHSEKMERELLRAEELRIELNAVMSGLEGNAKNLKNHVDAESETPLKNTSTITEVLSHVLRVRGWELDWRLADDPTSPSAPVRSHFNLGQFVREMLLGMKQADPSIAISVCDAKKTVVVYTDMSDNSTNGCKRLFNRLDLTE
jgi:hypothetical protein